MSVVKKQRFWRCFVCFAPYIIVLTCLVLIGLTVINILLAPRPDFTDPFKGVEARGTEIKARMMTWEALMNSDLRPVPSSDVISQNRSSDTFTDVMSPGPTGNCNTGTCENPGLAQYSDMAACSDLNSDVTFGLTFSSPTGSNLYELNALKAMCYFGERLQSSDTIDQRCDVHTLGGHVALLTRTSCDQLQQSHLEIAADLLTECAPYVYSRELNERCYSYACSRVPDHCLTHTSVFIILKYLVDINFMNQSTPEHFLTYAQMFVPLLSAEYTLDFYNEVNEQEYASEILKLVGTDDVVKPELFLSYIQRDALYLGIALLIIVGFTWIRTRSVVLAFALLVNIALSVVLAYFCYFLVFQLEFFPYLNLLAGFLLIVVAAGDLILYHDVWQQGEEDDTKGGLSSRLHSTLSQTVLPILVSRVGLAAVLYSALLSSITVVKCFAVFAGTVILCNTILGLLFLPAVVVVQEQLHTRFCARACLPARCYECWASLQRLDKTIFSRALPFVVNKLYPIWLVLFLLLAMGGFLVVFYHPRLLLFSSNHEQLLDDSELAENYAMNLRWHFYFELIESAQTAQTGLPLVAVWGLNARDTADMFSPDEIAQLDYDVTFNLSSREAQTFMTSFCEDLKGQSFIADSSKQKSCTIKLFGEFMKEPCADDWQGVCCGHISVPVPAADFTTCFPVFIQTLYNITSPDSLLGWPYFDDDNEVKAYAVRFESTEIHSERFTDMDEFCEKINSFMNIWSSMAPGSLQNGFVIGNFTIYDLQRAILAEAYLPLGVSLAIVAALILLATRNMLVSIYSMTTLVMATFGSMACLVLAGWQLDVLQVIIILLCVGLSTNGVVLYSLVYLWAKKKTQEECVTEVFTRVGSTVMMATFLTFIVGLVSFLSHIHVYHQLGTFLMVVAWVSWAFSTFFLAALCRYIGPLDMFGRIACACGGKEPYTPSLEKLPAVWHTNGFIEYYQQKSQSPSSSPCNCSLDSTADSNPDSEYNYNTIRSCDSLVTSRSRDGSRRYSSPPGVSQASLSYINQGYQSPAAVPNDHDEVVMRGWGSQRRMHTSQGRRERMAAVSWPSPEAAPYQQHISGARTVPSRRFDPSMYADSVIHNRSSCDY